MVQNYYFSDIHYKFALISVNVQITYTMTVHFKAKFKHCYYCLFFIGWCFRRDNILQNHYLPLPLHITLNTSLQWTCVHPCQLITTNGITSFKEQFKYRLILPLFKIALIITYTLQSEHKRYWNQECKTKDGPQYWPTNHIKDPPA
jgi:hypothetical protein